MRTNTAAQQATRRMTPEQKSAMLAERIAADHAVNEAHAARFQAMVEMWKTAYLVGLTREELFDLDRKLVAGVDPVALRASIENRNSNPHKELNP